MYALFNIIGAFIPLAVIIFITIRMWKRRPREEAISEGGAKRLREELNEEDRLREEGRL